jgi:hypothetical protein
VVQVSTIATTPDGVLELNHGRFEFRPHAGGRFEIDREDISAMLALLENTLESGAQLDCGEGKIGFFMSFNPPGLKGIVAFHRGQAYILLACENPAGLSLLGSAIRGATKEGPDPNRVTWCDPQNAEWSVGVIWDHLTDPFDYLADGEWWGYTTGPRPKVSDWRAHTGLTAKEAAIIEWRVRRTPLARKR